MTAVQRWQWLAIAVAAGVLVWLLAPVLTPFVIAAGFAYLGDPLAKRLQRIGCNRTLAASIVFLVMLLIVAVALLLLIPLVQRQIGRLIGALPVWAEWVRQVALPWLEQHLHLPANAFDVSALLARAKEHIGTVGNVAATLLGYVTRSGLALIGWVIALVLIPVVTFYLLRDWGGLVAHIDGLLPRAAQPTIRRLAREADEVLGAFVRGQLLVMIALGIYYALALRLTGLEVGPLIGMVAGLVSFVPYLGFIVGIVVSLIAALMQFHDVLHLVLVLIVFAIGSVLESYVLVPKLVGDKIGLHPVAVMFAVLAFGQLFGFIGVLLALPMASVLTVLLRYALERYRASALYAAQPSGDEPPAAAADHGAAADAGQKSGASDPPPP